MQLVNQACSEEVVPGREAAEGHERAPLTVIGVGDRVPCPIPDTTGVGGRSILSRTTRLEATGEGRAMNGSALDLPMST